MRRTATWLAIATASALFTTGCAKPKEDAETGPPPNEKAEMEAMQKQNEKQSKPQTVCPVMEKAINKDLYADVEGKRIYVCCAGCIATIKKDPAKYVAKAQEGGVVLEAAPK